MSSSDRMNDLSGHVVLVTGATDGLGRALCAELVELRAAVLVHGRSPERIEATVEELRSATATAQVRGYCADLASLAEVAGLARAVREGEPRLDALVSDAGIGTRAPCDGQRMESADRVELRFAVNYLAGYGLVSELLGLLRASAPARIVLVSSAGQTPLDFENVMLGRGYDGTRAYCQSKLAQVLQCFDLAEGWALDRRPEGVAERLRPVLPLGTCRARRGQAAACRASHRASGGAPSSMTNSRSTCTASTKVVFAPEPTAVASTA